MAGTSVDWTTIDVFADRGLAEVGGSALRSAGIPYQVVADDGQGVVTGPHVDGAELRVPSAQLEEARALLRVERPVHAVDRLTGHARTRAVRTIGWMVVVLTLMGLLAVELVRVVS